ncbi:class A beta-lactamase-related serine hydrolase [Ktedonosporobacter rubrisoli]|uniref:Class A beta-lactamase-related serine hydrolase n=1 Tax=Ktedonosporobacter rubrisoli TaxID=2509675 RepID=A0A4V0YZC6_KTERU|nr:serine hydrolase domain-containing protein [Ktedonosporobacter rubrisoli]QBD79251.1 class A beta-lactamase-related serine hydrolase [Ktedonosporobacter rubrisoli]
MFFDFAHWQARLDELRATHHVPGASLAVLAGGTLHELVSGVLNRRTGVEVTPASVFQVGSITKIHTATLIMQLAASGALELDAKVKDVMPEFATADPEATRTITIRQLLSHTSGLACDFTYDTGRGDDCLARYVEAIKHVPLDSPPGTFSYCSVGYSVLGRLIEVLTGQTWDAALKDRLCDPLGLASTVTLPEDVLRFRAAIGHLGEPGHEPEPVPMWNPLPRSSGPYGGVLCATASDIARLARMHLDGGTAPDGTRVLTTEAVAAMQKREVSTPDRWTFSSDWWGLGWALYDWNGIPGFGHDGATVGQYGYLRVVPESGVILVLLMNGGGASQLCSALFRELLDELAGVKMRPDFGPAQQLPGVDIAPFIGTYKREGVITTITRRAGKPHLMYEFVDGMKGFSPPLEVDLVPVSETAFAAPGNGRFNENWLPVAFSTLPDGRKCVYIGLRVALKIA